MRSICHICSSFSLLDHCLHESFLKDLCGTNHDVHAAVAQGQGTRASQSIQKVEGQVLFLGKPPASCCGAGWQRNLGERPCLAVLTREISTVNPFKFEASSFLTVRQTKNVMRSYEISSYCLQSLAVNMRY